MTAFFLKLMLKGKKILLGITGSIAVYKTAFLVRLLIKEGAEVKVIMSKDATNFVTPLTFSTLSKNKVFIDLFNEDNWQNHVQLARWADVFLIAPATFNTIGKMANGICDNLLLAVFFSLQCDSIVAPAMDEDMWNHCANKKNIEVLRERELIFLPVGKGDLASGLTGEGRMCEPDIIVGFLKDFFLKSQDMIGNNVLISAGPTQEAIDPVRFISNHSSGKMGICIAEEFYKRGATVKLVLGPTTEIVGDGIEVVRVTSAEQMFNAVINNSGEFDILCMAAAVADYVPEKVADQKIKKSSDSLQLQLKRTKDILLTLGANKTSGQILIGFALETENEVINASKKLSEKNADIIVMNSLRDAGSGFGFDTNKITIFEKNGNEISFPLQSKREAAENIVDYICRYHHE